MRTKLAGVVITVLLTTGSAAVQQRPDLSGAWIASTDKPSDVSPAPNAVFGPRFALQHTGETLTVARLMSNNAFSTTFTLDGREVRSRIHGGACQGESEVVETAAWEGNAVALTIVGRVPPGGGMQTKVDVKRLLRLQSADTLIVERSTRENAQAAPRQVGTVYKRSKERIAAKPPRLAETRAQIGRIAWLGGVWIGTGGQTTVEERWTPPSGGSMLATARTLQNGVMSAFEFLCISERDGGLVYTAMPNARTPPTDFVLTSITDDSATFENPAHDFPKVIRYTRLPDGSLQTSVGGGANGPTEIVTLKRQ